MGDVPLIPVIMFSTFAIVFFTCCCCCIYFRKKRGVAYAHGPNVTITTQHTSAVAVPPYPVANHQPMPQNCGPPGPGFATNPAPYPTHMPQPSMSPYPPPGGVTPYPPPAGGHPPYPVDGPGNYHSNPPPYDVAVSSPPTQPVPVREAYGKQAPYNPNYG